MPFEQPQPRHAAGDQHAGSHGDRVGAERQCLGGVDAVLDATHQHDRLVPMLLQQAQDRQRRDALPAPRFADDAQRLAAAHRERHVLHCMHLAGGPREHALLDREALDQVLQQRERCQSWRRRAAQAIEQKLPIRQHC